MFFMEGMSHEELAFGLWLSCDDPLLLFCCIDGTSWGQSRVSIKDVAKPFPDVKTIYLEVERSTWKPRGRHLYDVESSIRVQLTSMGFQAVRGREEPHDLTLQVSYREGARRTIRCRFIRDCDHGCV